MNEQIRTKQQQKGGQVVPANVSRPDAQALTQLAVLKAEIDQQIATAQAFPRSIQQSINEMIEMATIDETTAKMCKYAKPVGGELVTGPSIRFMEIVANAWGHIRTGVRVVEVNRFEKYVEAEGVAHDVQKNVYASRSEQRRIFDKRGNLYNDDLILTTGKAAGAIAVRNAIAAVIPRPVWSVAFAEVERIIRGDAKTLVARRKTAIETLLKAGVTEARIFHALKVAGIEDVGLDELEKLFGFYTAIRTGESSIDDLFPDPKAAERKAATRDEVLDNLGGKGPGPEHDPETGEITEPGAAEGPAPATGGSGSPVVEAGAAQAGVKSSPSGSAPADPIAPENGPAVQQSQAAAGADAPPATSAPAAAEGRQEAAPAAQADKPTRRQRAPAAADPLDAIRAKGAEEAARGEVALNAWLDTSVSAEQEGKLKDEGLIAQWVSTANAADKARRAGR